MSDNTEKRVALWLGLSIFLASILYVLVLLGDEKWLQITAGIVGLFLGGFLFAQAGVMEYFRRKEYKTVTPSDFVVWITIVISAGVFINSALLFGIVSQNAPQWLITFSQTTGYIVGGIGALLALVHAIMPRFK